MSLRPKAILLTPMVNDAGKIRQLKLDAQNTNLMVEDENAHVSIDIDGETIDKINSNKQHTTYCLLS